MMLLLLLMMTMLLCIFHAQLFPALILLVLLGCLQGHV